MIRLDWKLTLIKQINQSLDSEPSEFNGTNLTNFRSIKFVGKIDYNNQIYLYSLNEKGAPGFDLINPIIIINKLFLKATILQVERKYSLFLFIVRIFTHIYILNPHGGSFTRNWTR